MPIWAIILLAAIILTLVGLVSGWFIVAYRHYGHKVQPGDTYTVDGREYTIPNLPISGEARLLNEEFMIRQRKLLTKFLSFSKRHNILVWVSGGTLIAVERHKTVPIPWDDDVDCHTPVGNREYFFGKKFPRDIENEEELETVILRGSGSNYATKEGGAVRLRLAGTYTPVMDLFFVNDVPAKDGDNVCKIDSWSGDSFSYNKNERWDSKDIYPIVEREVDGMQVPVPSNTVAVLRQQYGEKVLDEMYARPVAFSHETPFSMLSFVWQKQ